MVLSPAIVDVTRLARAAETIAEMAGSGSVRAGQRKAMERMASMGVTALDELGMQLEHVAHHGSTEGVRSAAEAAGLVTSAHASLAAVRDAAAGAAMTRTRIPIIRSARFDVSPAEGAARDAAVALRDAASRLAAVPDADLLAAREAIASTATTSGRTRGVLGPEHERFLSTDISGFQRAVRRIMVDGGVRPFSVQSIGLEHIPTSGPFILAPVHGSNLDAFQVMSHVDRPVHFMAKSELWSVPGVAQFVTRAGAFPVDRGNAAAGEAMARELLRRGEPVLVFPEGTVIRADAVSEARNGVARLALESGAPVIPVGSYGNKPGYTRGEAGHGLRRTRVVEVFGEPIRFDGMAATPANQAIARERIWRAVDELQLQARTVYENTPA